MLDIGNSFVPVQSVNIIRENPGVRGVVEPLSLSNYLIF